MGKVKLGFVVNNLVMGGVSKVLINLCNSLDPEKYDIHLLILSGDLEMEKINPLNDHIKKHLFNYKFSSKYDLITYLKNSFSYRSTYIRAKEVLQVISDLNLDILHFHTLPRQLVIGILAKKTNPGLKLVFTDHSARISKDQYNWYQEFLLSIAYKRLYHNYNLIAVSKAVSHYIKSHGLSNGKLKFEMLENSISIADYGRSKSLKDSKQQFIYISRINNEKGHDVLIEAWLKLDHKNKGQLVIIGPDETSGDVPKLAQNNKSIVFTGSVSDVKTYLDNSTIAVFPSKKEGLPLALLEMMAFELPVIVSDIDELTSIVSHEKEGLHFKLDDSNDLVEKMELLLNNQELAIKLGGKARTKVEEICEKNDPVKFHDVFYNELLNKMNV